VLSESAVINSLQRYLKTSAEKGAIKEYQSRMVESRATELALELIRMVQSRLPHSISEVGDALFYSELTPKAGGGGEIAIYFDPEALRRDSLQSEKYDGIDNIVAMFNNGYRADGYVYGPWRGHSPTEGITEDYAWVWSKKEREALHFMQDAIEEFNSKYKDKYGATAVLGDNYKK
jgi:hypothetical protein